MATANAAQAKTAAAKAAPEVQVSAPSRREFLYYIWGASMVMLLGQVTAGIIWFAFPRFKEGEFGGVFQFNPEDLPEQNVGPFTVASGRFHISNVDKGLLALYMVCTHLGCIPKWIDTNHRFECPCHGSKFELDGKYIEGPAPRSLDRFVMTVTYSDGTQVTTNDAGDPIALDPDKSIVDIQIDTGTRILGPSA